MSPSPSDWFRDVVIYQLHVRSFSDSNGDGTGDFDGLTSRLDYIVDLGIDAIWLLPFFPSPLRDDGYDIADYDIDQPGVRRHGVVQAVPPRRARPRAAGHRRAGDEPHVRSASVVPARPALATGGSRHRDYYVWSDTTDKYTDARIIFTDTETSNWTWDPVAQAYYWHRFYSHQPDLNFDSPDVRREMFQHLRPLVQDRRRRRAARRDPIPVRTRGHELREPARDARLPEIAASAPGRALPGADVARRGEPVAGGCRRVLRRRRRVPHGVPLPGDAAAVPGRADGEPRADRRHPRADAGDFPTAASGRCSCATTTS